MKSFFKILLFLTVCCVGIIFYLLQPSGTLEQYKNYFPIQERARDEGEISVTFFGNTTLLFDDGKSQILFDPFLSRPSKWNAVFGQINSDSTFAQEIIAKYFTHLEGIFVSHSHVDHILDLPIIAQKTKAKVYGTLSVYNYAQVNHVATNQLIDYNSTDGHKVGTFHVLPIPSIHSKPNVFNNDLNQVFTSNHPLPYKLKEFKEGGSFDFLITHGKKRFLIKASYNHLEGQYVNEKVDVVFLGVTGFGRAGKKETEAYFKEVINQNNPAIVVPIHWDDFLTPLKYPLTPIFRAADNIPKAFDKLIEEEKSMNYQFMLMDAYQTRVF